MDGKDNQKDAKVPELSEGSSPEFEIETNPEAVFWKNVATTAKQRIEQMENEIKINKVLLSHATREAETLTQMAKNK